MALCAVLVLLLADAGTVREGVQGGLRLCIETVIPSLFPFFVLSSLLISLGFAELLGQVLEGLMRPLFRVGGNGASALVLGLVGGYPVGARTVTELYRDGLCSRTEAHRLLAFCNNTSPAFILSVLGLGVFDSVHIGLWLYLIHVASALLTGLCFRRWGGRGTGLVPPQRSSFRAVPLAAAFVQSVQAGLRAMASICAFVLLFSVVLLPFSAIPGLWGAALSGSVELFNGASRLPSTASGFLLCAVLLGWGGLCVHCQTLALLSGSGLSSRSYFLGKAVQALLSALLAALLRAIKSPLF